MKRTQNKTKIVQWRLLGQSLTLQAPEVPGHAFIFLHIILMLQPFEDYRGQNRE